MVCPTQAIVSGDIDDPVSEISRLIATEPAHQRAPEQGTSPKLWYLGAQEAAIDPLQVSGGEAYLMNEVVDSQREKLAPLADEARATVMADIAHPPPWGWKVSSYFLSKGVAAGAMMLAVILMLVGARGSALADVVPGALALGGIAVTGVFLIWDLKQPRRFIYLFTRPQWRSWLTIGAQFINLAGVVATAFLIASLLGADGARDVLRWVMIPAGTMLAAYTAFLFNQCEGRDLWQSPLLFPHTIVNALVAGASALGIVALGVGAPDSDRLVLALTIVIGVVASAVIIALDLFGLKHPTRQAERAARNLWRDRFALRFWLGGVALGLAAPAALAAAYLATGAVALLGVAGAAALAGMWCYEDAWVRAGQSVPLS